MPVPLSTTRATRPAAISQRFEVLSQPYELTSQRFQSNALGRQIPANAFRGDRSIIEPCGCAWSEAKSSTEAGCAEAAEIWENEGAVLADERALAKLAISL